MNLYKLINTRMCANAPGTVMATKDTSRPFIFNGVQHPGVYYDYIYDPLVICQDYFFTYPINLLKDFITSEKTLHESLAPSLQPSVPGAPQRDQGFLWEYLGLAAMSHDRVEQVLKLVKGPVARECVRLKKVERSEEEQQVFERRVKGWEECIAELEEVLGLQGQTMRAYGEKWSERQADGQR